MSEQESEWALGSGFDLDGATVTVTEMEFGYNASIGAGVVCANFTFEGDDGDPIEQSFSVGNGWTPSRDGTELVSESGRAKKINKNTNFGILIQSVMTVLDDPETLGGSPRFSSTWLGRKVTMGTVQISRLNPSTGETKDKDVFVVTEFHDEDADDDGGDDGGETAEDAPPKKKAPAKKRASRSKKAAPKDNGIPDGVDEELWNELVEMAKEFDDHDEFVEEALDDDDVESNQAAQKAVLSTKAGSIWALAHA